jgi:hypothetical protein
MIYCAREHTLQRGGEYYLIRTILNELQTTRRSFAILCARWQISSWVRRKNVFVILFPMMPLIMEMNQPLINADFDFKRFRNKAQLNNSPTDGYKCVCVHFAISASSRGRRTSLHCAQPGLMPTVDICLYSMIQTLQFIIPAQSIPISNSSTSYLISHIC